MTSVLLNKRTDRLCEKRVGYDRFTGEFAYRQLTEVYRALRVYVNCFQPSRDSPGKATERGEGPMQRLLLADVLSPPKREELLRITQALDPIRLLGQLEQLQKALFQHVTQPGDLREAQEISSPLAFSAPSCTEEAVPVDGIPGTPPAFLKHERKRKRERSFRPHDWRTRKDPFEGEWEDITAWLQANPALTGVEIFQKLVQRSPDRYRPTQVRTLQRHLGKLRAQLLVTFDDQWGNAESNGFSPTPELRAEIMSAISAL
jgi:hypothetical protein